MKRPLVSIIIISCNRPLLLQHCLERVYDQPYPDKEVIVVDSSSNDESEKVIARYPGTISVRLRGQRNNMPYARNEGMAVSSGDLIAFIDDDSMIFPLWLNAMVDAYKDESIGAVGGRIIRRPEPYCDLEDGSPSLLVKPSGIAIARDFDLVSEAALEVDHLVGCNMSFRRAALEQIGGFDSNYTLTNYREETDMFIRLKKAGWRIMFVPAMSVRHVSARSAKPFFMERPYIQFSNGRNSAYLAYKNFGFNFRTVTGQFLEIGAAFRRAGFLVGLGVTGLAAQLGGRAVGMAAGVAWHVRKNASAGTQLNLQRPSRTASEPEIIAVASSEQLDSVLSE
ncbi:MAG TPA: glycosyltransferase [Ktedonobacteraceae bacterium]|nr:glycosyltransferase [Ktedonobacteraceae bacterium]